MNERRTERSPIAGLRPIAPLAVLWFGGSVLLLALVKQNAVPIEELLLDPTSYNKLPWYTGMISNLGVLGWTTATVAAAGAGWVSRLGGRQRAAQMLRGGSLLSALLLLDDLFQLHIVVSKTIGTPKAGFYAMYFGLALWWSVGAAAELRRTRWPLLAAAGAAFGGSVVVDQLGTPSELSLLVEDSLKFLGILAWAQYYVLTARDITRSIVGSRLTPAEPRAEQPEMIGPSAQPE